MFVHGYCVCLFRKVLPTNDYRHCNMNPLSPPLTSGLLRFVGLLTSVFRGLICPYSHICLGNISALALSHLRRARTMVRTYLGNEEDSTLRAHSHDQSALKSRSNPPAGHRGSAALVFQPAGCDVRRAVRPDLQSATVIARFVGGWSEHILFHES